jgi:methionyl-tRNA formyltransferase
MNKLSIGYFADGPWSHNSFKKLIEDKSLEIKFIVPRKDTNDQTLKEFATKYDIQYLENVSINSEEFYNRAREFKCDLFVSMSFDQIFRNRIINIPQLGTINCHAGKLPFYRGRNVLNWVLINDEKEFGITVHYVDEGIDTGDIILQGLYPISDNDDYNTLLNTSYDACADLLYQSVKLIQSDKVASVKQSTLHPTGFYCGKRGEGDEIIDWSWSSRRIFNFIRAICKPGPLARTKFKGELVLINKAGIIVNAPNYINTPGQLLAKTEDGFLVKTGDSYLEIYEIESGVKLKVGDKLS